jgi:hypothetical protein
MRRITPAAVVRQAPPEHGIGGLTRDTPMVIRTLRP